MKVWCKISISLLYFRVAGVGRDAALRWRSDARVTRDKSFLRIDLTFSCYGYFKHEPDSSF